VIYSYYRFGFSMVMYKACMKQTNREEIDGLLELENTTLGRTLMLNRKLSGSIRAWIGRGIILEHPKNSITGWSLLMSLVVSGLLVVKDNTDGRSLGS